MERKILDDLVVPVNWCPKCDSAEVRVVDSREDDFVRKRRKTCMSCRYTWNTVEISEYDFDRFANTWLNAKALKECLLK